MRRKHHAATSQACQGSRVLSVRLARPTRSSNRESPGHRPGLHSFWGGEVAPSHKLVRAGLVKLVKGNRRRENAYVRLMRATGVRSVSRRPPGWSSRVARRGVRSVAGSRRPLLPLTDSVSWICGRGSGRTEPRRGRSSTRQRAMPTTTLATWTPTARRSLPRCELAPNGSALTAQTSTASTFLMLGSQSQSAGERVRGKTCPPAVLRRASRCTRSLRGVCGVVAAPHSPTGFTHGWTLSARSVGTTSRVRGAAGGRRTGGA